MVRVVYVSPLIGIACLTLAAAGDQRNYNGFWLPARDFERRTSLITPTALKAEG